ncbi:MAG: hypothetical protein J6Z43_03490 [Clostridiales bacterium]|nr:hypothetical protein [Clostridiales bacterium]
MNGYEDDLQLLLALAADEGREKVLFGECLDTAQKVLPDYLKGDTFPKIYLEFPLTGEPFLEVTVGYGPVSDTEENNMLKWVSDKAKIDKGVCCGYELDLKNGVPIRPAIHFQPRRSHKLVEPFLSIIGEHDKAPLYHSMTERLPESWQPAMFGLFRGRPGSPLRIGGYLSRNEIDECIRDKERIPQIFERAGFKAYDGEMIEQLDSLMSVLPDLAGYQFDIFPDGSLGDVFAIDLHLPAMRSGEMHAFFEEGDGAGLARLLSKWEIIDRRFDKVLDMAFAGAIPVQDGLRAYVLRPDWIKVRWTNRKLQPAKMYVLTTAGLIK